MNGTLEIRMLGSLAVLANERDVTPSAPKLRTVIALLAASDNRTVSTETLIDELWADRPPTSATTTLQTYIYHLRRLLSSAGFPGEEIIETRPLGYQINISPESVDLFRFERLAKEGQAQLAEDDVDGAAGTLNRALEIWRGPALSDVPRGRRLASHAIKLEESRFNALETRIDAELRLGRHRGLVSELKGLISQHPLVEGFYARLMLALHHCGRRSEALSVYRSAHRTLAEELGLTPSEALQQLHQEILNSSPAYTLPRANPPDRPYGPAMFQLPPDISDFIGREEDVERIKNRLLRRGGSASGTQIVTIHGMSGAGKSTLATHVGHRLRSHFPGSQLHLNLSRPDGPAVPPAEAVGRLLAAVGLDGDRLDGSLEHRRMQFRTWSADRQLLVVLDGVSGIDQVRPLVPTGPGSAVIVVSRGPLSGLTGSFPVPLDGLRTAEGIELLARIAGAERVRREPESAEMIVRMCDGFPLALRIVGERLVGAPHLTLQRLRARLADEISRLDQLRWGDLDVRAGMRAAYRALRPMAQRALQMLSVVPVDGFTRHNVADVLGVRADHAESLLLELASMRVVQELGSGVDEEVRYHIPELMRLYATEVVGQRPALDPLDTPTKPMRRSDRTPVQSRSSAS